MASVVPHVCRQNQRRDIHAIVNRAVRLPHPQVFLLVVLAVLSADAKRSLHFSGTADESVGVVKWDPSTERVDPCLFSLELWLQPWSEVKDWGILYWSLGSVGDGGLVVLSLGATASQELRVDMGDAQVRVGISDPYLYVWHHIAVSVSSCNAAVYLDGRRRVSQELPEDFVKAIDEWPELPSIVVGVTPSEDGAGWLHYDGSLDSLILRGIDLSPDYVSDTWRSTKYHGETEGCLGSILCLVFNEGFGRTVFDLHRPKQYLKLESGVGYTSELARIEALEQTNLDGTVGGSRGRKSTNYALDFSGVTGYVAVPNFSVFLHDSMTIEMWVMLRAKEMAEAGDSSQGMYSLLSNMQSKLAFLHFQMSKYMDPRIPSFHSTLFTSDGAIEVECLNVEPYGVWRHVAFSARPGRVATYENGYSKFEKNKDYVSIVKSANSHLFLGLGHGYKRTFAGKMDEVRVWNWAWDGTPSHGIGSCGAGPPSSDGLIASWSLGSRDDGVVVDSGPYFLDGFVNNVGISPALDIPGDGNCIVSDTLRVMDGVQREQPLDADVLVLSYDRGCGFCSPGIQPPLWIPDVSKDMKWETCSVGCQYVENRELLPLADIVLFEPEVAMNAEMNYIIPEKLPHQYWAMMSFETPKYYAGIAHSGIVSLFDYVATFKRDANMRVSLMCNSHFTPKEWEMIMTPPKPPEEKPKFLAVFASNCKNRGAETRTAFLKELMEYVPVDSYGRCLNNMGYDHAYKMGWEGKIELLREYKFYLAFENHAYEDYVSEKIHHGFIAGAVPVYAGSRTIDEWSPSAHSVIKVWDFPSAKELAEFLLYLNENDDAYREYLSWKFEEPSDMFKQRVSECAYHVECRMCQAIHEIRKQSNWYAPKSKWGDLYAINLRRRGEMVSVEHADVFDAMQDGFTLSSWVQLVGAGDLADGEGRIIMSKMDWRERRGIEWSVSRSPSHGVTSTLCINWQCFNSNLKVSTSMEWRHLAVSVTFADDIGTILFCRDDACETVTSESMPRDFANNEKVFIGSRGCAGMEGWPECDDSWFHGMLDHITVWVTPLSQDDIRIKTMFSHPDDVNLALFLPFNEPANTYINDDGPYGLQTKTIGSPEKVVSRTKPYNALHNPSAQNGQA